MPADGRRPMSGRRTQAAAMHGNVLGSKTRMGGMAHRAIQARRARASETGAMHRVVDARTAWRVFHVKHISGTLFFIGRWAWWSG